MTTMCIEDPALPEKTEGEAWYDAEIAPALAALAKRCHERGMAFVSVVEYQPGDRGRTVYMTEGACLEMEMVNACAASVPNIDLYVMRVLRLCAERGIDVGASIVLRSFSRHAAANDLMREVQAELARPNAKFPTWPTDPLHALAVLGEEFGELTKDMLQLAYEPDKTNRENVRKEAIQTAAMALRLVASLDVYVYRQSAQRSQADITGAVA